MAEFKRPSLTSALSYQNPKAAFKWLEEAFGFEPFMVILTEDGELAHSEMRFGDSLIMVGSEWSALRKSPKSIDGYTTQSVHIQLDSDLDAHCEHARKAGARIEQEPEDQFYGDRTYRAYDLEDHVWTFGQTVKSMTNDEMAVASGLIIRDKL